MTSASKVAFIAGFDLFLTPIFGLFIPTFKQHAQVQLSTWMAVFVSLIGLFLLSGANLNDFEMGMGETLTLISTIFWTMHITYTDIATTYVDTMTMMCIQMGCVSFLSACVALYLEPHQWFFNHQWLYYYWPWIIYLAITEGLGFTLMATGQNTAPPTHAAIILSLEGVFAAVSSYVFLGEHLDTRETIGCILMLASTLAAEVGCPAIDNLCLPPTHLSHSNSNRHSPQLPAEGSIIGEKSSMYSSSSISVNCEQPVPVDIILVPYTNGTAIQSNSASTTQNRHHHNHSDQKYLQIDLENGHDSNNYMYSNKLNKPPGSPPLRNNNAWYNWAQAWAHTITSAASSNSSNSNTINPRSKLTKSMIKPSDSELLSSDNVA